MDTILIQWDDGNVAYVLYGFTLIFFAICTISLSPTFHFIGQEYMCILCIFPRRLVRPRAGKKEGYPPIGAAL